MQLNTISKLDILSALDINFRKNYKKSGHVNSAEDATLTLTQIRVKLKRIYDLAFVFICNCHGIMETIRKKGF